LPFSFSKEKEKESNVEKEIIKFNKNIRLTQTKNQNIAHLKIKSAKKPSNLDFNFQICYNQIIFITK